MRLANSTATLTRLIGCPSYGNAPHFPLSFFRVQAQSLHCPQIAGLDARYRHAFCRGVGRSHGTLERCSVYLSPGLGAESPVEGHAADIQEVRHVLAGLALVDQFPSVADLFSG